MTRRLPFFVAIGSMVLAMSSIRGTSGNVSRRNSSKAQGKSDGLALDRPTLLFMIVAPQRTAAAKGTFLWNFVGVNECTSTIFWTTIAKPRRKTMAVLNKKPRS